MADDENTEQVETVETEAATERGGLNIRAALEQRFAEEAQEPREVARTAVEPTQAKVEREVSQEQAISKLVAPPTDMNKEEREAFLNPTAENAHILQSYLSRRSHETRTDYERRKAELEKLQRQTKPLYDAYEKNQKDYVKLGLSPQAVYERSIEWDMAMRENPIQTALEWLDAYGLTPQDLYNPETGQYETPAVASERVQSTAGYLTKEEAERIAEEKMRALLEQQQQKVVADQTITYVQSFMQTKPLFTGTDPQTAAQLEERMAPIVQALAQQGGSPQEVLETAYNYVVKGDPIFSELERKLTAAESVNSRKAETAKAKKASKSISGSVGSGSPRMSVKDIRENLRRRLSGLD